MRRHKSIVNLSRDHHQGLILAQLIKKNAPHYNNLPYTLEGKTDYTLNAYKMDLLPHFKKEEEILFPFIKGMDSELEEVVNQLLIEHKEITDLIIRLKKNNNKEDILDELGNLLTQHIRREERELFDIIQKILTDEELENLDGLLN
jgi:iron-sulfur cluster repair protein YtfE (RIC family)